MAERIGVFGASGLVGSRFVELYPNKEELLTPDLTEFDITSIKNVASFFDKNEVSTVVNFAAFTNVDGAEKERGDENGVVWRLNVDGVKNLIEICKEKDIFLVQISTDFVFRGDESDPGPYSEDKKLPDDNFGISWYGWTKNRVEKLLNESGVRHAVVRIAYPFYAASFDGKLDFAKGFLKLFDEGKLYPVFADQIHSVLNVDDLIEPLTKIMTDKISGTFHVVASDTTTPFEFVSYLLEKTKGAKDVLQKGSMKEFLKVEGRTPRPRLGGLKTEITEKKLGVTLKTWREMVDELVTSS
ncbi:MAG: sugar nucleotide-binding protein [Patescibacteria group bacterium]